jgi:hypothetical protein
LLFGRGQTLDNYYIEVTPYSEMLCYQNEEGREFDLPINDEELGGAAAATGDGRAHRQVRSVAWPVGSCK